MYGIFKKYSPSTADQLREITRRSREAASQQERLRVEEHEKEIQEKQRKYKDQAIALIPNILGNARKAAESGGEALDVYIIEKEDSPDHYLQPNFIWEYLKKVSVAQSLYELLTSNGFLVQFDYNKDQKRNVMQISW